MIYLFWSMIYQSFNICCFWRKEADLKQNTFWGRFDLTIYLTLEGFKFMSYQSSFLQKGEFLVIYSFELIYHFSFFLVFFLFLFSVFCLFACYMSIVFLAPSFCWLQHWLNRAAWLFLEMRRKNRARRKKERKKERKEQEQIWTFSRLRLASRFVVCVSFSLCYYSHCCSFSFIGLGSYLCPVRPCCTSPLAQYAHKCWIQDAFVEMAPWWNLMLLRLLFVVLMLSPLPHHDQGYRCTQDHDEDVAGLRVLAGTSCHCCRWHTPSARWLLIINAGPTKLLGWSGGCQLVAVELLCCQLVGRWAGCSWLVVAELSIVNWLSLSCCRFTANLLQS